MNPIKFKTLTCRPRVNRLGAERYFVEGSLGSNRVQRYFKSLPEATDYMKKESEAYEQVGDAFFALDDRQRVALAGAHLRATDGGYSLFDAVAFYEAHRDSVDALIPAAPMKEEEPEVEPESEEPSIALSKAAEIFEDAQLKRKVKKDTVVGYLAGARAIIASEGDIPVNHITADTIREWLEKYENPTSYNTNLRGIKKFTNWLVKEEYIKSNPADKVEKRRAGKKANVVFGMETIKRLLRKVMEVRPEAINYFSLCLFAGVRPEEVDRMEADHVNLEEGYVMVKDPKTGGFPRIIMIDDCGPLRSWLESTGGFVPDDGKGGLKHRNWDHFKEGKFRNKFQQIYRECGWEDWPTDALRKTFCSYHKEAFSNMEKTNKIAGHGADVSAEHYENSITSFAKTEEDCTPEELADKNKVLTRKYAMQLWKLTPDKLGK